MTRSFRASVGWSIGRSVCCNFLKGRGITLPCSYRNNCFTRRLEYAICSSFFFHSLHILYNFCLKILTKPLPYIYFHFCHPPLKNLSTHPCRKICYLEEGPGQPIWNSASTSLWNVHVEFRMKYILIILLSSSKLYFEIVCSFAFVTLRVLRGPMDLCVDE